MRRSLAFAVAVVIPLPALAQGGIVGTVRDASGGVLGGVAVETSSPALIERARRTSTDASGRYRFTDLRPGTYEVLFTRPGFMPLRLTTVELSGSITATVNATLALGRLTDTIDVTRAAGGVDVHAGGREWTLRADTIRELPVARSYNALLALVPGVVTSVNDTVTGTAATSFPIHGGRTNEGRLLVDGLNVGSPPSGNSATSYAVDPGNAEEITFSSAGARGESETAGLLMNIVPRTGGNETRVSVLVRGSGRKLQSDNLGPELRMQGVAAPTPLTGVYDVSGTIGGPIVRDRIWYFAQAHMGAATKETPGVYYNLNAGNPSRWLYAPDRSRAAYSDRTFENASARISWQVTARNRVTAFWDVQSLCRTCSGATPGLSEPSRVSPEAVGVLGRRLDVTQVSWSSPVTDRLLVEAAFGGTYFGVGNFERKPNPTRDLIRVVEQCASGCAANGAIPGLAYRSQDFSDAHTGSYLWQGSLTYGRPAYSVKLGYQHTLMTDDRTWMTNSQNLTYRFNNGVPNQLTQSISPWVNDARVAWDGVYAQGQWTRARVTLQGALRFDRARSWFPEQREGPSRFLSTSIVIPRTSGVDSYNDVSPRLGIAWDVFGTGSTAVKFTLGRFLEGAGAAGIYANANPSLRMPQTTTAFGTAGVMRSWTDANGNFVPDCDLANGAAQDLRDGGGDFCGAFSNASFGQGVLTNNFDPRVLEGWGVRPADWNLTLSMQRQLGERSSVDVTYTRRWYRGFFVVDNLALEPADSTPFSLAAPLDPRLPGGGGYVVSGLYDVVPAKFGSVENFVTNSEGFGAWSQYFNGIDVIVNIRLGNRFTAAGGTSTGQTVADSCRVRARLPELSTAVTGTSAFGPGLNGSAVTPLSPYCHVAYGVLTQFRGLSSYVIPRIDVQVAATFQTKPGAMLAANYAAPNAEVAPSLGRNLSGGASNVTVNLVRPGTLYGDRINQLDLRAAKIIRWAGFRTTVGVDVYNALNSNAVLSYNNTFVPGGTWLQPLAILTPRLFRVIAEVDF